MQLFRLVLVVTTWLTVCAGAISTTAQRAATDSNYKGSTELRFEGDFLHHQPLSELPTRPTDLLAFFQDPVRRDHLLKGGGNPTYHVDGTPELYTKWREEARVVGSQAPVEYQDPILAIHSTVPLFPGLSIKAVSYTGCKLSQHPETSLPIYEFTLIEESYIPSGPKAMVWLFDKVTGGGGKKNTDDDLVTAATQSRQTHSFCRVHLERQNGAWNLQYYGKVQVACQIPSRLLKMLPLSKSKVESKVSRSIVKQLEREGLRSLQKFKTALEDWKHVLQQADPKRNNVDK